MRAPRDRRARGRAPRPYESRPGLPRAGRAICYGGDPAPARALAARARRGASLGRAVILTASRGGRRSGGDRRRGVSARVAAAGARGRSGPGRAVARAPVAVAGRGRPRGRSSAAGVVARCRRPGGSTGLPSSSTNSCRCRARRNRLSSSGSSCHSGSVTSVSNCSTGRLATAARMNAAKARAGAVPPCRPGDRPWHRRGPSTRRWSARWRSRGTSRPCSSWSCRSCPRPAGRSARRGRCRC